MTFGRFPHVLLDVLAIAAAGSLLGCGGSAVHPSVTPASMVTPDANLVDAADMTPTVPVATSTDDGGPSTPPLANGILPTQLASSLPASLNLAMPPSLDDLSHTDLLQVMRSFTKSLGTTCDGCHQLNPTTMKIDPSMVTNNMRIAKKMWEVFVTGLATADGKPIYCDSCHQGRKTFLDRSDPKALAGWMKQNYVALLTRRDGAPHGCQTCHGNPFDGQFLKGWAAGN